MLLGFLELLIVALFLWRLQVAASRSRLPHGGEAGITTLAAIAASIASAVGSAAAAAGSAAAGAAGAIGSAAGAAGSALGSAAGSVGSALGSAGSAVGSGLSSAGGAVESGLSSAAHGIASAFGGGGSAAGSAGASAGASAGEAIGATGVSGTSELIGTAGAPITPGAVTSAGATQGGGFTGILKGAASKVQSGLSKVSDVEQGLESKAEGFIDEHPLIKAYLKARAGGTPETKEDFLAQAFLQLTKGDQKQQRQPPPPPTIRPLTPLSETGFEIPRMQEGGFIQPLGLPPLSPGVQMPQPNQQQQQGQDKGPLRIIEGLLSSGPAKNILKKIPGMQEGGQIAQGQAIVGEKGPELITVTPAGAQVTPLPRDTQEAVSRAAAEQTQTPQTQTPQTPASQTSAADTADDEFKAAVAPTKPPSTLEKIGSGLADFLIFANVARQGIPGIATYLQQRRILQHQTDVSIATKAISNPDLLRVSPDAARAVDSLFGAGTAQGLLNERNPNIQARHIAALYGIKLQPGSEFSQLNDILGQAGFGLNYQSTGKLTITRAGRTAQEQDAILASNAFQTIKQAIMAQNPKMDEATADQLAAKRTVQVAAARGFTVPKPIQDFADATTQTQIETARAAAKAAVEQATQLKFAGAIAEQREAGRRVARLAIPISPDEIQLKNAEEARALGGVSIGRDPKDEALINASQQNQVLKQLPDGSFVAIPRDRLPKDDTSFLDPSTLLSQRIARQIAARTTNQQQNAKIVLQKLDEVDALNALDILVPASKQGPTLPEQVAGAIATELKGQTVGRLTLFAGIRSPDDTIRAKALSLYNLQFIINSVVKATGDTGNISDTDRENFKGRLERIFTATASREEAATTLMQMRQLMLAAAAGTLTKEEAHRIINNPNPSPQAPPPGFQPVPGTGAHFQVTP
jgi:hypothetical protein